MARRITLILLSGVIVFFIAMAAGEATDEWIEVWDNYGEIGEQNAQLGARMTQYVLEKAVANGVFDMETVFDTDYELIPNSDPPRYHSGYDQYFERNLTMLHDAFLEAEQVYYAYAIRDDGYVPTHTDPAFDKRFLEPVELLKKDEEQAEEKAGRRVQAGTESHSFTEYASPIYVGGRRWGEFRVGIPVALVHGALRRTIGANLAQGVTLSLLLGIVAHVAVQRGLRPLRELAKATSQMARGDLSARAKHDSDDELGFVSRSFNTMAERIEHSHDELEQRVHDRTADLESMIENNPAGIVLVDAETRCIVRANENAVRMMQGTRADIIGQYCQHVVCSRENQTCPILDGKKKTLAGECTLRTVNGKEIPVHKSAVQIVLDGRLHLLETITDISELKGAQVKLQRVQKALDDASDAVLIVENDGSISYFNVCAQNLFRRSLDSLNADGWEALFADRETARQLQAATFNLDQVASELDLVTADGHRFPAEVRAAPILNDAGEATGILLFLHDIAERRRAEEELRAHAEKLQQTNAALKKANADAEVARQHAEQSRAELEAAQAQLVDASRQAGMAEVATGVLHNVGNVLNSVNVSARLVTEKINKSRARNVGKAADLINTHSQDLAAFLSSNERGKQLPAYLAQLGQYLTEEHEAVQAELKALTSSVEHIRDIVATQQSYAGASGMVAPFELKELVEDALHMGAGDPEPLDIRIIREYENTPNVTADRQKVLQILINLVRNAKHALRECDAEERQLIVRIDRPDETQVSVRVIDNGVGIPRENLTRIFSHGFTTRKDGHGFGLHSSALAAKQLGGALEAHSEGAGHGATFTLKFPIQPRENPS